MSDDNDGQSSKISPEDMICPFSMAAVEPKFCRQDCKAMRQYQKNDETQWICIFVSGINQISRAISMPKRK